MRDGRYDRLDEAPQPYIVLPASQFDYVARLMLLVDTGRGEPSTLGPEVNREINRIDPNLPIGRMLTGPEFLATDTPGWEGILRHGTYHQHRGLGVDL